MSIVANKWFGRFSNFFIISCPLVMFLSCNLFGLSEKNATSEPEIRAEHSNNINIAAIANVNSQFSGFKKISCNNKMRCWGSSSKSLQFHYTKKEGLLLVQF